MRCSSATNLYSAKLCLLSPGSSPFDQIEASTVMSVENMIANGVTNQRHLRYGASTLIRDKIYPADLKFYRRQIVRENIPRPEVPDVPTTTSVINDLLDYTKKINLKQEASEKQMLRAKQMKRARKKDTGLTYYVEDSISSVVTEDLNLYLMTEKEQQTVSREWKAHCVDFNPGSVLDKEKVQNAREKKRRQDLDRRTNHIQQMHVRWGRKFGFSKARTLELEERFKQYDADDSGFIDLNECESICRDLKIFDKFILGAHKSKKREILKKIIDELDRTRSGTLNFIQFMDVS